MNQAQAVSVIVPTLNEAENIPQLLARLHKSMQRQQTVYEVLIVDDNSSDGTADVARALAGEYPVRVFTKNGNQGKAHSLLQGFELARYEIVCMIDADLQYPPEAIGPMQRLLTKTNADVVITERQQNKTTLLRKLSTFVFNLIFVRFLFGLSYDTQSGLKLFRKSVLDDFEMTPSPWSFDLEFLVRSLENKRKIITYSIPFSERWTGVTKVKMAGVAVELAKASLQLRWNTSARKIRSGLKANDSYVRNALPATIMLLAALAAIVFANPMQVAAATNSPAQSPAPLNLRDTFTRIQQELAPGTNDIPATETEPVIPVNSSANNSAAQITNTSPITGANFGTGSGSSQTAQLNGSQASAGQIADKSLPTGDRSKLKPATGGSDDIYKNKAYTPSQALKHNLFRVALVAFASGALFILMFILINVIRKFRYQRNYKLSLQ